MITPTRRDRLYIHNRNDIGYYYNDDMVVESTISLKHNIHTDEQVLDTERGGESVPKNFINICRIKTSFK